jgi:hypothetical protein
MPSGGKVSPQVADSIAKFWDRQIKPPKGGWHYNLSGNVTLERHSEAEIHAAVKQWRQNNQTFASDLDIERELWVYYCNREPKRCKNAMAEHSATVKSANAPVEVTKEMQGPPIWTFLNTLAVQWQPALADYFLHTVDTISAILVCPICQTEWQTLLRNRNPRNISSKLEACIWVNAVHNEVNARVGKPAYPYSRMVTDWGAPLPL